MSASKFVASTLIAMAALAGTSAFAEGRTGYSEDITPSTSNLTRAEVRAEAIQARKDGALIQSNGNNYPAAVSQNAQTSKTRAEVQAEYRAARQAGAIPQYRS